MDFGFLFTNQWLDANLNNAKSTCLNDLKFSCTTDIYKNICVKFGWKRPSIRKLIWSGATTCCCKFLK